MHKKFVIILLFYPINLLIGSTPPPLPGPPTVEVGYKGNEVDRVRGNWGVSSGGSFQYSIPIGGGISLVYGGGGYSPAGIGFRLAGFDAISRGGKNYYFDGCISPVKFTPDDKYYLSGSELLLREGVQGQDGSVYQPRLNGQQVRVTAHGNAANSGPSYFIVHSMSGEKRYYGETAESRVLYYDKNGISNGKVVSWLQTRSVDPHGNETKYFYKKHSNDSGFVLEKVQYGGNSAKGIAPYGEVLFHYLPLTPDLQEERFFQGMRSTIAERLYRVEVIQAGVEITEFQFVYEDSPTSGRARMTKVRKFDQFGNAIPPTVFEWTGLIQPYMVEEEEALIFNPSNPDHQFYSQGQGSGYSNPQTQAYRCESNGDGFLDTSVLINQFGDNRRYTLEGSHAGKMILSNIQGGAGSYTKVFCFDIDGDGIADQGKISLESEDTNIVYITIEFSSTGTIETEILDTGLIEIDHFINYAVQVVYGDWNGDQLGEIALIAGARHPGDPYIVVPYVNEANKLKLQMSGFYLGSTPPLYSYFYVGDFNRDGRSDLLHTYKAGEGWATVGDVYLSRDQVIPGQGQACGVLSHIGQQGEVGYSWDLGIMQVYGDWPPGTINFVPYHTGAGLQESSQTLVGDVNGDGTVDIVQTYWKNGVEIVAHTFINDGAGNIIDKGESSIMDFQFAKRYLVLPMNINNDGRLDLAVVTMLEGSGEFYYHLSMSQGDSFNLFFKNKHFYTSTYEPTPGPLTPLKWSTDWALYRSMIFSGDIPGDGRTSLALFGLKKYTDKYGNPPELVDPDLKVFKVGDVRGDMLENINDAFGQWVHVQYAPMTDASVYQVTPNALADVDSWSRVVRPNGSGYLTKSVTADVGNGVITTNYTFFNSIVHRGGLGSLGYTARTVTNSLGDYEHSGFRTLYPLMGKVSSSHQMIKMGGVYRQLGLSTHTWSHQDLGGGFVFTHLDHNNSKSYEPMNEELINVTDIDYSYDSFGSLNQSFSIDLDGRLTNNTMTYFYDTSTWIGRQSSSTTAISFPSSSTETRSRGYHYDYSNGLLTFSIEQWNSNGEAHEVVQLFEYDDRGNITDIHLNSSENGSNSFKTVWQGEYDVDRRFLLQSENALGHTETYNYNEPFGALSSVTDSSGGSTTILRDGLGREVLSTHANGSWVETIYAWSAGGQNAPLESPVCIRQNLSGYQISAPEGHINTYFDRMERPIRSKSFNFEGQAVWSDQSYSLRGQVTETTLPYSSNPTGGVTITYDNLGRVISQTGVNGVTNTVNYLGLVPLEDFGFQNSSQSGVSVTVMNNLDQVTQKWSSRSGDRLYQAKDNMGGMLSYHSDGVGRVEKIMKPMGDIIEYTRDEIGRVLSYTDSSGGLMSYKYDSLSQLIEHTDAKGQVTTRNYDDLGRIMSLSSPDQNETYTWDTAGDGRLGKVESTKETVIFQYNAWGGLTNTQRTVHGNTYSETTSYDSVGRVYTYTNGITSMKINYNTVNYAKSFENALTGRVYKQIEKMNNTDQVTQELYGNNVQSKFTYDSRLNLVQIRAGRDANADTGNVLCMDYSFDALNRMIERVRCWNDHTDINSKDQFQYDNLNRLKCTITTVYLQYGSPPVNELRCQDEVCLTYDKNGNITSKSDVQDGVPYVYVGDRLQSVGNKNFVYDARGDLTLAGDIQFYRTSFGKPSSIRRNAEEVAREYGLGQRIIKDEEIVNGNTVRSRKYVNSEFRIEEDQYGNVNEISRISLDSMNVEIKSGGSQTYTSYTHRDIHGSGVAVSEGNYGYLQAQPNYDIWGKARNWDGCELPPGYNLLNMPQTGFTGHEPTNHLGLIYMRAREYDPELGRFMRADDILPDAGYTQGLNRYSYVYNSPPNLTDPTGNLPSGYGGGGDPPWGIYDPSVDMYFVIINGERSYFDQGNIATATASYLHPEGLKASVPQNVKPPHPTNFIPDTGGPYLSQTRESFKAESQSTRARRFQYIANLQSLSADETQDPSVRRAADRGLEAVQKSRIPGQLTMDYLSSMGPGGPGLGKTSGNKAFQNFMGGGKMPSSNRRWNDPVIIVAYQIIIDFFLKL